MATRTDGYPDTPECQKMSAVADESQSIGQFLDWLMHDQDVHLMRWESIRNERPCTAYKRSRDEQRTKQELLDGLMEIDAQLRGVDISEVEVPQIPEDDHPDTCACKGTGIYVWFEEGWHPVRRRIEEWLAEYYDIDLGALEQEKQAVLAWVREQNG